MVGKNHFHSNRCKYICIYMLLWHVSVPWWQVFQFWFPWWFCWWHILVNPKGGRYNKIKSLNYNQMTLILWGTHLKTLYEVYHSTIWGTIFLWKLLSTFAYQFDWPIISCDFVFIYHSVIAILHCGRARLF